MSPFKFYDPEPKIKVIAAAAKSARPASASSNWRSQTKIAAGRHGTRLAGITAAPKQAIAHESAMTISKNSAPLRVVADLSGMPLLAPTVGTTGAGTVAAGTTGIGFGFGFVAATFLR
jgi:hypothetical protein